jgi:DNA-binding protein YbaB
MFQKAKQLNELRKLHGQAKSLQRELEVVKETVEDKGIQVTVSGDQKIIAISIDGEDRRDVVDTINKALKEVQKKAAKKMMEMGGGLGGLLGGMGQ